MLKILLSGACLLFSIQLNAAKLQRTVSPGFEEDIGKFLNGTVSAVSNLSGIAAAAGTNIPAIMREIKPQADETERNIATVAASGDDSGFDVIGGSRGVTKAASRLAVGGAGGDTPPGSLTDGSDGSPIGGGGGSAQVGSGAGAAGSGAGVFGGGDGFQAPGGGFAGGGSDLSAVAGIGQQLASFLDGLGGFQDTIQAGAFGDSGGGSGAAAFKDGFAQRQSEPAGGGVFAQAPNVIGGGAPSLAGGGAGASGSQTSSQPRETSPSFSPVFATTFPGKTEGPSTTPSTDKPGVKAPDVKVATLDPAKAKDDEKKIDAHKPDTSTATATNTPTGAAPTSAPSAGGQAIVTASEPDVCSSDMSCSNLTREVRRLLEDNNGDPCVRLGDDTSKIYECTLRDGKFSQYKSCANIMNDKCKDEIALSFGRVKSGKRVVSMSFTSHGHIFNLINAYQAEPTRTRGHSPSTPPTEEIPTPRQP